MNNTASDRHRAVLHAAFHAWMNCGQLRMRRLRNKRFTYGDQWGDTITVPGGRRMSEGERFTRSGQHPITNNLLRQLVKSIVGRYRAEYLQDNKKSGENSVLHEATVHNQLHELDSRAMEEFLISGCCVQRVDDELVGTVTRKIVRNVNLNNFFIDTTTDTRGWDCHLVGQCHDLTLPELLHRVAGGSRRKAAWVRGLYCEQANERTAQFITSIGGDVATGTDFWQAREGKCRAIEVWTLESREVLLCHNHKTAQLTIMPYTTAARRNAATADVTTCWDVIATWHCRWFSPMGDLLLEYDTTMPGGSHPFVFKFYPLTDGEVHAFIEDTIDQQKYINRLISIVDHILMTTAKGVLLYPETSLPDGFTWSDVRKVWSSTGGILPYNPQLSDDKPQQISANGTDIGVYEMIALQLKLFDDVSGVSGALQGHSSNERSAGIYELQARNSAIALTDIFDTFTAFREARNRLLVPS